MRLVTDDCLVYQVIETDEDCRMLQQDLDQLTRWVNDWQMRFNVSKCYSMHVTSTQHKPTPHTYTMNSEVLANVKENPYLGVMLSHAMKWTSHIEKTVARGKHLLGFLRRNLRRCGRDLKAKAYKTLVHPVLEYCSPILDPYESGHTPKVKKVQREAARFVFDKPHCHSA